MKDKPKKANRYGPPHFSGKEGRLSIWLAVRPLKEMREDYFEENYANEDRPFTLFSEEFGFSFYDHDLVEVSRSEAGPKPIRDLLAAHSCSASFLEAAAAAAAEQGVTETALVLLMYDFDYDYEITGVKQSDYLFFLGSFHYDKGGRSAAGTR